MLKKEVNKHKLLNHDNSLEHLADVDLDHLIAIKGDSGLSIRQIKKDDKLNNTFATVGFRKHGDQKLFINNLVPALFIENRIIESTMMVDYLYFNHFLENKIEKKLDRLRLSFEREYSVFQLRENHQSFNDIEYYELCYSSYWVKPGYCYFLFRFYVDHIETTIEFETDTSKFDGHYNKYEAQRPKIIISAHYKELSSILVPFFDNYQEEISQFLELTIEKVDDDVLNLLDMLII